MHCNNSFPIIVMTRNDGEHLAKCVNSIIETVTIPITIYIVDNHSDCSIHLCILDELSMKENVIVIKNKHNRWILGLNPTVDQIVKNNKYFVLTDGDIDFSKTAANPCWLTYLIDKMESNISLGKIGMSLDWKILENNKELVSILQQEQSLYSKDKMIDELYVSSVDTTAAIYRNDWSIEDSARFYPDHMRYLRPELYSCRTSRDMLVEHLGWENYIKNINNKNVNSKVVCFALVGGDVKEQILNKSSFQVKWFYKIFSKLIKRIWLLRRLFKLFSYIFKKGWRKFDGFGAY